MQWVQRGGYYKRTGRDKRSYRIPQFALKGHSWRILDKAGQTWIRKERFSQTIGNTTIRVPQECVRIASGVRQECVSTVCSQGVEGAFPQGWKTDVLTIKNVDKL